MRRALVVALGAATVALPAMVDAQQCAFANQIDPYTMYNNSNGDSAAQSSDDCKSNCCGDPLCDVWQWSDDPMTPPNCWRGNSSDYGDSGGVEWQGEQGKSAPAPVPIACDLANCSCAGVDLSKFKGKVFRAPTDAEGYAYSITMCGEISKPALPSGCQQSRWEHPAVVKYKGDNPADCIEIGSIGPCSQGECGMAGVRTAGGGVEVTYTYTYGCKNTFTLTMTPGSAGAPGQVISNECSYTATWAGLGPPPPPATPFRCIDNKCQPSAPGLPGLDNQTCTQTCGPLSGCLTVLYKLCQADKVKGVSMTDSSSDPVPHARRHTQPSPAPLPHLALHA